MLVEINCETDFVARNDDFQEFAREIALHIAAADPQYVSEEDVPEEARSAELRIFEEQAADKPENVRGKIAEGRLRKWLEEVVLLKQEHVNKDKHGGQTIEEHARGSGGEDRRERRHPPLHALPGRGVVP